MHVEKLTFATQGNEYSWHAEAARQAAGTPDVEIIDCNDFSDVVAGCINYHPGLGVMAINTAKGTVEKSAWNLLGRRSAALPHIVKMIDLTVGLAIIGHEEQSIEALNRPGVTCYLQAEAQMQIDEFKRKHLPKLRYERRKESTHAVKEALDKQSPDHIAIGPTYSAQMMGGFILGPKQINPAGSVTSFYIMQRDPRLQLLPSDSTHNADVTVIGLNYPEGPGEFEKCLDAIEKVGIHPVRYIPYRTGEPTKHNPDIRKNGGILEIQHDIYDPKVKKFCAKINAIKGLDGYDGPFDAKNLGGYTWHERPAIIPQNPINVAA